ncbi:MAG: hypothetical protein GY811_23485 [Myxococcales bacterium]|nr:hypothetical protein [Myxococcales bacterium]
MALTESTLATELEALTPDATALEAVHRFAAAYAAYIAGATVSGSPILATSAGETAMVENMAFPLPGTAAGAAAAISAGVVAYWGAMVATPAAHFTGATIITPPPEILALTAALTVTLADASKTLAQQAAAMAGDLHAASTGATATLAAPPPIAIL